MAEYDWSDARKGIEAIRAWLSSVGGKPEFEPLGKRVTEASEAIPESTKEALRALSPTATRLRDVYATEQETHAAGLRSGRIAEGEEKARDYLSRERHTAALERLAATTQGERSSEKAGMSEDKSPSSARKAFSLSRDDALFWIGVAVFGDGLYLLAEHPMYAVPLIIAGVALLAWSNRGHMPKPPLRLAMTCH